MDDATNCIKQYKDELSYWKAVVRLAGGWYYSYIFFFLITTLYILYMQMNFISFAYIPKGIITLIILILFSAFFHHFFLYKVTNHYKKTIKLGLLPKRKLLFIQKEFYTTLNLYRKKKVQKQLENLGYKSSNPTENLLQTIEAISTLGKTNRLEVPVLIALIAFPVWGEFVSANYNGKAGLALLKEVFLMLSFAYIIFSVAYLIRKMFLASYTNEQQLIKYIRMYLLDLKKREEYK